MMNFCEFSYDKLLEKLKKVHFNKYRMDFALIVSIEDVNKEINEIVKKINNSEIVTNQDKVAINLLYGLILLNDPELWAYYNQKYLTFYN
jgi:predicted transglutaminase-like cysteine proteinase